MLVCLFIYFQLVPAPVATRKYDIEVEAMKLYGDDLKSVLARFRRTPEYLEFLKLHLDDLKKERDETAHYLLNIYHKKLVNDIDTMFGVNATRRGWPNIEDSLKLTNIFNRADENVQNTSDSEEAVRKLDSYHLLHSELTVDERNNFRDHGFQVAGELIHALMKSVGPNEKREPTGQSTRQPWNDQNGTLSTAATTTEHSHTVTRNSSMITIYANALNSTSKKPLRFARERKLIV